MRDIRAIGSIGANGSMRHESQAGMCWRPPFEVPAGCVAIRVKDAADIPARWIVVDPGRRAPAGMVRGFALCEVEDGEYVLGDTGSEFVIHGDRASPVRSAVPVVAMFP